MGYDPGVHLAIASAVATAYGAGSTNPRRNFFRFATAGQEENREKAFHFNVLWPF